MNFYIVQTKTTKYVVVKQKLDGCMSVSVGEGKAWDVKGRAAGKCTAVAADVPCAYIDRGTAYRASSYFLLLFTRKKR